MDSKKLNSASADQITEHWFPFHRVSLGLCNPRCVLGSSTSWHHALLKYIVPLYLAMTLRCICLLAITIWVQALLWHNCGHSFIVRCQGMFVIVQRCTSPVSKCAYLHFHSTLLYHLSRKCIVVQKNCTTPENMTKIYFSKTYSRKSVRCILSYCVLCAEAKTLVGGD